MSDRPPGSGPSAAERAARANLQAEHRAIVQATMQAKRSGKLPATQQSSTGADAITAIVVIAVVIGMLMLVMRYAH